MSPGGQEGQWLFKNGVASRSRAVILVLSTGEATPGVLGPQLRRDVEGLEQVQRRAARLVRGLEHKSCKEQLRELGVFSLERKRLRAELVTPQVRERRE